MNRLFCLRWISNTQRKENFSHEARTTPLIVLDLRGSDARLTADAFHDAADNLTRLRQPASASLAQKKCDL
jgi:hypothetical protein